MSSELKTLSTKEVPIFNGSWREFGTFKHAFESFAIVNGVGDVILYEKEEWLACALFLHPSSHEETDAVRNARHSYLWKEKNRKCYAFLQQATSRGSAGMAAKIVKDSYKDRDGREAWMALLKHYEEMPGQDAAAELQSELFEERFIPGEDPALFFSRLAELNERVKRLGTRDEMNERALQSLFLNEMSKQDEYKEMIRDHHNTKAALTKLGIRDTRTAHDIVEVFASDFRRRARLAESKSDETPDLALPAHHRGGGGGGRGGGSRENVGKFNKKKGKTGGRAAEDIICYACDGTGHYARDCQLRKERLKQKEAQEQALAGEADDEKKESYRSSGSKLVRFAAVGVTVEPTAMVGEVDEQFLLDSGCSSHMNDDISLFKPGSLVPISGVNVTVGGKRTLAATHRGTIEFVVTDVDGREIPCVLSDVLYVPELGFRLLSQTLIMEKVGPVIWDKHTGVRVDGDGFSVSFRRQGNLWVLPFFRPKDKMETALPVKVIDAATAHIRYGHASSAKIKRLIDDGDIEVIAGQELVDCEDCSVCVQAKQQRKAVAHTATPSGEDTVQIDLAGPFPKSYRNERFAVVFIHHALKFVVAYMIITKDKVINCLDHYIKRVLPLKHQDVKVTTFQTDGAAEFTSKEWEEKCAESGIKFRHSPPRTQSKNGAAEKVIHTLCNMMRALMFQCRAKSFFWSLAFLAAVYLYNRLPHSSIQMQTPHELWYGSKADLSTIRSWGCAAYVWKSKDARGGRRSQ